MKGVYKTKARNLIVDYLKANADKRFTARDIVIALSENGANIDRSTIYRNIERLCADGKLVKYKENDINATCYQYSEGHGSCHSHMHAQCENCGKIYHLENDIFADAEEKLKKEYGIEIDFGRTVIIGRCDECKEADGHEHDGDDDHKHAHKHDGDDRP